MLELTDVDVVRGATTVLHRLSLSIGAGEAVAVIGANGAGKTTLLRTILGLHRPVGGSIRCDGRSVIGRTPEELVRQGLVLVPEGRRVFANMTVRENLDLGAFTRSDRRAVAEDRDAVLDLFPRLQERGGQTAGTLSGGEQGMLALGRALMARPRLLLLDEPSLGIAPLLAREILTRVRTLNRDRGLTVLLVEQNARLALARTDRAIVLESGRAALTGRSTDLAEDPRVRELYLGGC